jgi:partner of Y14 and mago protein
MQQCAQRSRQGDSWLVVRLKFATRKLEALARESSDHVQRPFSVDFTALRVIKFIFFIERSQLPPATRAVGRQLLRTERSHVLLSVYAHTRLLTSSITFTMPSVPTPTKAGIVETNTGERHIPSSTRPDGSKRKEIKIRPGYKPPEDVEVYKNRTSAAFKNRGSSGVPGAEGLKEDNDEGSAASNKNAKRREARKKAKAAEESGEKVKGESNGAEAKEEKVEREVDPEVEKEKKARNLKKKLKQAKELKEKKEGGAALLPEQFAKVIKINELIRELDALGFDADGEPKAKMETSNS